jgi:probable HAF family extracellular repeat protein
MPSFHSHSRTLLLTVLAAVLASWGCSPEEDSSTGPSRVPPLAVTAAATYTIRDLGFQGQAFGINNAGTVVGSSMGRAFRWQNGVFKDLGTIVGGHESQANAINNSGVIAGWSRNSAGDLRAVRWTPDGRKRSLGTLGGRESQALGINDLGVIVGWSRTAAGQQHAFKWENGVMTDLGTMPAHGASSVATDINRGGAIVGYSEVAPGERHAFKWKDGVFKDLGTGGTQSSKAFAINTKGQIAGILGPPPDAAGEEEDFSTGFLFYQDVMTRINHVRHPTTQVNDISPTGIVVGSEEDLRAEDPRDNEDPWFFENGITTRLPELSNGFSGAQAINLAGTIAGYSQTASGQIHVVIWRRR